MNSYVKRNFGAKIKVARKSHVNKNESAVDALKKNFPLTLEAVLKNQEIFYPLIFMFRMKADLAYSLEIENL